MHCINYNSGQELKKRSNFGWYIDVKYNNKGKFIHKMRSQVEIMPTFIVSLGDER